MFDILIQIGKVQVTWLEAIAFVLALACVLCNVLEVHWGWPLAIVSSALYAWLFFHSKLYGDAGIQVFFVFASFWGWWQWMKPVARTAASPPRSGQAPDEASTRLRIRRLTSSQAVGLIALWLVLWALLALALGRWTDSDVAWADAFPTAGSMLGQVLLGRKVLENWAVWQAVNLSMVGLLAYKGLWLSAVLYGIFGVMAVLGWRRWSRVSA